ncbi:type II/IV secretion system ATPase subunit, partial [Candidatus Bathyarchaeota archaeon]|nr:type II/IV secretion system ATPase subunit [Candidatus Bathyarchaeota archaeon]
MYLNNWGLQNIFRKKKKKVIEESEEDIAVSPLPENSRILDEYWVYEPYAKIVIAEEKAGKRKYYVMEERLDVEEKVLFEKLLSFMERELDPPTENVDREKYVISAAESLMNRYKRLKPASEESKGKILYYVVRELVGFSHIHPIMLDPNIEDISCNGINMPIYVYHRYYESLPTNIVFLKEDVLDDFIIRLAHQAGKHISSAHPILDATLPGKHRLAATFMREVSNFGSTFCIRKFRENPFSITELISMGTINKEMAAYLWILVENKMSIMV